MMLALLYVMVWIKDRKAWLSLVFSLVAFTAVGHALLELGMMIMRVIEVSARCLRLSCDG